MRHPFEDKIGDFITRHQMLNSRHRYLVALSGGADSVCLLRVLSSLGYEVEAVHCNFHLRGEESDRDEQFCEQLCKEQNTPFHRVHFDTQTFADLHHLSIEMAARELRYQYFHQLSQSIDIQGVCVAHHLDDNVETVLMNLVRGTGIHGLTGMRPSSFLPVKTAEGEGSRVLLLRPLLCVSRQEIEDYLSDCGATFVTDSRTITIMLILRMGHIMSIGFEKTYLMQNSLNLSKSEIISTFVYKIGLGSGASNDYSYSTAIGMFNSVVNLLLISAVNWVSGKISENSLW